MMEKVYFPHAPAPLYTKILSPPNVQVTEINLSNCLRVKCEERSARVAIDPNFDVRYEVSDSDDSVGGLN